MEVTPTAGCTRFSHLFDILTSQRRKAKKKILELTFRERIPHGIPRSLLFSRFGRQF